jgi:hypothetical protein
MDKHNWEATGEKVAMAGNKWTVWTCNNCGAKVSRHPLGGPPEPEETIYFGLVHSLDGKSQRLSCNECITLQVQES